MRDDILKFTINKAIREAIHAEIEPHIKRASEESASEAIHATLTGLGIDAQDHKQTQADMHYLRKLRLGSDFISRRILTGVISVLVGAGLWLLWESIQELLRR